MSRLKTSLNKRNKLSSKYNYFSTTDNEGYINFMITQIRNSLMDLPSHLLDGSLDPKSLMVWFSIYGLSEAALASSYNGGDLKVTNFLDSAKLFITHTFTGVPNQHFYILQDTFSENYELVAICVEENVGTFFNTESFAKESMSEYYTDCETFNYLRLQLSSDMTICVYQNIINHMVENIIPCLGSYPSQLRKHISNNYEMVSSRGMTLVSPETIGEFQIRKAEEEERKKAIALAEEEKRLKRKENSRREREERREARRREEKRIQEKAARMKQERLAEQSKLAASVTELETQIPKPSAITSIVSHNTSLHSVPTPEEVEHDSLTLEYAGKEAMVCKLECLVAELQGLKSVDFRLLENKLWFRDYLSRAKEIDRTYEDLCKGKVLTDTEVEDKVLYSSEDLRELISMLDKDFIPTIDQALMELDELGQNIPQEANYIDDTQEVGDEIEVIEEGTESYRRIVLTPESCAKLINYNKPLNTAQLVRFYNDLGLQKFTGRGGHILFGFYSEATNHYRKITEMSRQSNKAGRVYLSGVVLQMLQRNIPEEDVIAALETFKKKYC